MRVKKWNIEWAWAWYTHIIFYGTNEGKFLCTTNVLVIVVLKHGEFTFNTQLFFIITVGCAIFI